MDSMLDMYLFETNTLLEQLDEILLDAEKNGEFTLENINEIFRIMHTVKGSSAMMQFDSLMTIAHKIEDLFFIIREQEIASEFTEGLFELMFMSSDFLKIEAGKVQNNEPLTEDIGSFEKKISDFLSLIKNEPVKEDAAAATEEKQEVKASKNKFTIKIFFEEGCGMENLRSFIIVQALKDVCENYSFYPEDVETNPESANIIVDEGFQVMVPDQEELDAAMGVVKSALNIRTYEIIEAEDSDEEVEQQETEEKVAQSTTQSEDKPEVATKTETKPAAKQQKAAQNTAAQANNLNKQSLISVNLAKLDKLMDIVGEIAITESMVISSPDIKGLKLDNFTKSARQLRKLTDELQNVVMSVRMVQINGVFQKMNRIVRDMTHKLNKNVKLEIIGEDTEMDKTIVDSISDPIMHLVRNAMDHGIESNVEDRIALGKSEQGKITLMAEHTGSEVLVTIKDDGKGVDPAFIMEKAKRNNILTKPEHEYTEQETLMLLMTPGFSTKEQVTEFSGRGVGMDVVKKNVEKVGGVISIASELGHGTTITFKIPLTLAIISGMEVSVGESTFIIPIHNVKQSIKISKGEVVYDADKNEMFAKNDKFYPILRLHEFYSIDTDITNIEDGMLIWVEFGEKAYCLFVDELLGEQQIVVKPLPPYISDFKIKNSGIAGCTILGNGSISIILDVQNLNNAASTM